MNNIYQTEFFKNKQYDKNYFTLIVSVDNYCNFSCEYCCENCNIKKDNFKNVDFNSLFVFIKNVLYKKVLLAHKKLKLSLYGGEPTLHPKLYDFCKQIFDFDNSIAIEIYTNFYKDISFYKKLLDINVTLIITYHYNQLMPYNDFFKKFSMIEHNYIKNNIVLNIMFEHNHIEQNLLLFNMLNEFLAANKLNMLMPILLKQVRNTNFYTSTYTKNQQQIFNKIVDKIKTQFNSYYVVKYSNNTYEYLNDEELELKDLQFTYWQCSAGNTSLYVDVNGYIFKCISYAQRQQELNKKLYIDTIYTCKNICFSKTLCISSFCTDYDTNKLNIFKKQASIYK